MTNITYRLGRERVLFGLLVLLVLLVLLMVAVLLLLPPRRSHLFGLPEKLNLVVMNRDALSDFVWSHHPFLTAQPIHSQNL